MGINIAIICGSGIATSTIATNKVQQLLKEMGVSNYTIRKGSVQELPSLSKSADLILTTNKYSGQLDTPHMNVIGFLTGIKEEQLKKELSLLITKIINDKKE